MPIQYHCDLFLTILGLSPRQPGSGVGVQGSGTTFWLALPLRGLVQLASPTSAGTSVAVTTPAEAPPEIAVTSPTAGALGMAELHATASQVAAQAGAAGVVDKSGMLLASSPTVLPPVVDTNQPARHATPCESFSNTIKCRFVQRPDVACPGWRKRHQRFDRCPFEWPPIWR